MEEKKTSTNENTKYFVEDEKCFIFHFHNNFHTINLYLCFEVF